MKRIVVGIACGALALLSFSVAYGQDREFQKYLTGFEQAIPKPGDAAPNFVLEDEGGKSVSLADLLKKGPVVIEFASFTCLEARERRDREALVQEYAGKGVQFVLVFTREEYAGEWVGANDFTAKESPTTMDDRRKLAREFRTICPTSWTLLLDTVNNKTQRDFGHLPNSAYVIAPDGTILYKERWASADGIREALAQMFAGGFDAQPARKGEGEDPEGRRPKEGEGDPEVGRPDPKRVPPPGKPERNWSEAQWREWMEREGDPGQWEERGRRIGREIENDPAKRRKLAPLLQRAMQAMRQAQQARENGNYWVMYEKWEEYKKIVRQIEKELGIPPKDPPKGDRGDRGDNGEDHEDGEDHEGHGDKDR